MTTRISPEWANAHNFAAGPGALPESVLDGLEQAVKCVPGVGLSIFGIGHRTDWFKMIVSETKARIRTLAQIPDDWEIVFLQGGATLQFSMAPINLGATSDSRGGFIRSGYWAAKAIAESASVCTPVVLWDGSDGGHTSLPDDDCLGSGGDLLFTQYVSNETVDGVQFGRALHHKRGAFSICDVSSDFLTRRFDFAAHDIVYAHAQKNIGPAGMTIVMLSPRAVEASLKHRGSIIPMLSYAAHIEHDSVYNTPPVFEIYAAYLSTGWMLREFGDMTAIEAFSRTKASLIYAALDGAGELFRVPVLPEHRSISNVVFDIPNEWLAQRFAAEAEMRGFYGVSGHRSRGGFRVSLYNGVSVPAAFDFAEFIREFAVISRSR